MRHYGKISDMPDTLSVFPLTGVLLLPRAQMPLNIFEPRYLSMIDAAMAGNRLIGMVQPTQSEDEVLRPPLSAVGCAGRITAYQETDDGRYLVTLTGICRFRVAEEPAVTTAFRQARVDYAPFADDLKLPAEEGFPRERVATLLRDYLTRRDLKVDWGSVMSAPPEALVNALCMLCPFEPREKQALLEAPGFADRVDILIALLEMSGVSAPGGNTVN